MIDVTTNMMYSNASIKDIIRRIYHIKVIEI